MYVEVFYRLFCCKNQWVVLYLRACNWTGLDRAGQGCDVQSLAA